MNWQEQNIPRSRMNTMVSEAKKQALEMNSKSRYRRSNNKSRNNYTKAKPEEHKSENTSADRNSGLSLEGIEKTLNNVFESLLVQFGLDKDKALILVLIFVLYRQKADKSLLFALLYILL